MVTDSAPAFSDLYLALFGAGFILFSVSILLFGRYTVARIERELRLEGRGRPARWDSVGLRLFWYASALVLPVGLLNERDQPFIDVELVRAHAGSADRLLGLAVELSGMFMVGIVIWGVFG